MNRDIHAMAFTMAALLALSAGRAQAVSFSCKPLIDSTVDFRESLTTVTAINNRRQAVGLAFAPYDGVTEVGPAVWGKDRQAVRLNDETGGETAYSIAYDINDAGRAVGETSDRAGNKRALSWTDGVMTELPGLPGGGVYASASSINRHGKIVGYSRALLPTGEIGSRATMWIHGQPRDLGALDKNGGSEAVRINDDGTVIGQSSVVGRDAWMPVRWVGGKAEALPLPEGTRAFVQDVNGQGAIVGQAYLDSDKRWHAYAWQGDAGALMREWPNFTGSSAQAINDSGVAVGTASLAVSDARVALYWPTVGAEPVDLNTLVDEGGCVDAFGLMHPLEWAADISDKGVIVANSTAWLSGAWASFSFRLTPH